jgi:hypothetical protein
MKAKLRLPVTVTGVFRRAGIFGFRSLASFGDRILRPGWVGFMAGSRRTLWRLSAWIRGLNHGVGRTVSVEDGRGSPASRRRRYQGKRCSLLRSLLLVTYFQDAACRNASMDLDIGLLSKTDARTHNLCLTLTTDSPR